MPVSFLAPENTTNVTILNNAFKVDANRVLTVPDHLADHVRALGWPYANRKPIEVSTTRPAPVVASGRPVPVDEAMAAAEDDKGLTVNKNAPTPGDTTGSSTITDDQMNQGERGAK